MLGLGAVEAADADRIAFTKAAGYRFVKGSNTRYPGLGVRDEQHASLHWSCIGKDYECVAGINIYHRKDHFWACSVEFVLLPHGLQ